jgi:hypothetical protein
MLWLWSPGGAMLASISDNRMPTNSGRGIAIDAAGGILVAGTVGELAPDGMTSRSDMRLWRFKPALDALDTTFASPKGYVTYQTANRSAVGMAVAIDAGGRIVVAGFAENGAMVWRYR